MELNFTKIEKAHITELTIKGYKAFSGKKETTVQFNSGVNLFIGPNGAGKSSFISFFKFLNMLSTSYLQEHIAKEGGANSLLHYGLKETTRICSKMNFENAQYKNTYSFDMAYANSDTLIFTDEKLEVKSRNLQYQKTYGVGQKESELVEDSRKETGKKISRIFFSILRSCQVFQFHDTSLTARIRQNSSVDNIKFLYSDGGNLAPYLLAVRENYPEHYLRIIGHIQNIFPQFKDFELYPPVVSPNFTMLRWLDTSGAEYIFEPHQISDGTLRFMALATLLLQPEETAPGIIIIDEPELGLHPAAITDLADMMKIASQHSQVIVATQSPRLINEFDPHQITVVEWDKQENCSQFTRLDEAELSDWLLEYSLEELWDKNVIGGRP